MNIYFYTVTFKDGRASDVHIKARNKRHAKQGLDFKLIGQPVKDIEFNAVEKDYS